MKRTFRFTLYVKDTDKVFGEGMGPGELVIDDYTYGLPEDYRGTLLAHSVLVDMREMIEKYIDVRVEEL